MPPTWGEDCGGPGTWPGDGVVAWSDAEARSFVEQARRAGTAIPPIGLAGGDLCRTLGGPAASPPMVGEQRACMRADIGSALVDGRLHWFVAHLVARRSWWRGRIVVIMNASWLGSWDVAPRAHPGDGRLEVVDADPPVWDRLRVWRRLPSGSHVPHPAISVRSVQAWQAELPRGTRIHLDGEDVGVARTLSVRIEPGAVDLFV
jgi:hypothetical protein